MWKFNNIYKETIWGGTRIAKFKGEKLASDRIGECWQLSAVEGAESTVCSEIDKGFTLSHLIEKYGDNLLGKKNHLKFGNRFPLLIKLIDANDDLSIQVHPDDRLAKMRGAYNGKSEMWYVLECSSHAKLIDGFKQPVDPAQYSKMIESGNITDYLRLAHIKANDVYYIPAGRVHALGSGVMVVEIQQTSDLTYRIFDYHRTDANGNRRELHTELAFDAIDFSSNGGQPVNYTRKLNIPVNLVSTPHFTANIIEVDSDLMRDYSEWDTFVALIATNGSATVRCGTQNLTINAGETILVPAEATAITISPYKNFAAIETFIK